MNLDELQQAQREAYDYYILAKENLKNVADDEAFLAKAAQEANDAWLKLKKLEKEFNNLMVLKKGRELYGL
jgi:hypothetical protein